MGQNCTFGWSSEFERKRGFEWGSSSDFERKCGLEWGLGSDFELQGGFESGLSSDFELKSGLEGGSSSDFERTVALSEAGAVISSAKWLRCGNWQCFRAPSPEFELFRLRFQRRT